MKSVLSGMSTLLNAGRQQFVIADLYTFTLLDGTVLRYACGDGLSSSIPFGGINFIIDGPQIERSAIETAIGLKAGKMDLTIYPLASHLIGSTPFLTAVRRGALDGATVRYESCVDTERAANTIAFDFDTSRGSVLRFLGRVSQIDEITRDSVQLTCKDPLELLDMQLPRDLYQSGCANTLFDSLCLLAEASFAVSGTVSSATALVIGTALTQPADYFSLGRIKFTSGPANGIVASVKSYAGGTFTLLGPLSVLPAAGNTFTAYPGCPKTMSACANADSSVGPAFDNIVHFRGYPFVPTPDTTT